jgi:threonine dehydrogenase-like Zn-dependent dehydrogenase
MTKNLSMRAVVFQGVGKISVEQRPRPQIQDQRDVILKVSVAALCGSDLHWYRGHQSIPTGFIPGHEFVGTVHELGSEVKGFSRGDVVVVCDSCPHSVVTQIMTDVTDHIQATFSTQCGNCFYCRRQQTSRCASSFLFGKRTIYPL